MRCSLVSLLAALAVVPRIACAQYPVTDGAALTQRQGIWAQEALQWADSIDQQRQAIQHQITIVTQGVKNLTATPLDMLGQIQGLMTTYTTAMAEVQGVGYTIENAKQQWANLYGAATSSQPLPVRAAAIAQALQQVSSQANQMQAIYARLCQQTAQLQTALMASKAAPGTLAAQQAHTQLTAVLSDQLQTLTQIQASAARVYVMQTADDARTSEQAVKNSQNWSKGLDDPSLKPVGFGLGQGRPLPQ